MHKHTPWIISVCWHYGCFVVIEVMKVIEQIECFWEDMKNPGKWKILRSKICRIMILGEERNWRRERLKNKNSGNKVSGKEENRKKRTLAFTLCAFTSNNCIFSQRLIDFFHYCLFISFFSAENGHSFVWFRSSQFIENFTRRVAKHWRLVIFHKSIPLASLLHQLPQS